MSSSPDLLFIPRDVMKSTLRTAESQLRDLLRLIQSLSAGKPCDGDTAHQARILTRKFSVTVRLLSITGVKLDRHKLRIVLRNLRHLLAPLRQADLFLELYSSYCSKRKKYRECLLGALHLHWQMQYRQAAQHFAWFRNTCQPCLSDMTALLNGKRSRLVNYHWRKRDDRWFARQIKRWEKRILDAKHEELHRSRIKTRQFRYLCQLLDNSIKPEPRWQRYLRELEKIQDLLGRNQDMLQIINWLNDFEMGLRLQGKPDQQLMSDCLAWRRHCLQTQARLARGIETWLRSAQSGKLITPGRS